MTRHVTIFSDASQCQRTKTGGWACWIKTSGASAVVKGGAMKGEVADAFAAEIMGIANALAVTKASGWMTGSTLMIQCDSIAALQVMRRSFGASDSPSMGGIEVPFSRRSKNKRPDIDAVIAAIGEIIADEGATFVVRHVRGHKTGDGRQYVNRLVDQTARAAMKFRRRRSAA